MGFAEGKCAFDDPHCTMAAFESIKIQIVHTCTATANGCEERMKASDNIKENMKLLHEKHLQRHKPNPYHRRLFPLLSRFGFHDILSEWSDSGTLVREKEEIVGPAEVGYLSNAAPFRLAKLDVQGLQRFLEQKPSEPFKNTTTREEVPGIHADNPPLITGMYLPETHFPPGGPFLQSGNSQSFYSGSSGPNLTAPEDLLDISALSSEDFVRLAEEMSGNITWDISHMPY
ncbi:hypothetical protein PISL3812_03375 [Talaromyces islandicus]|uniref:Uncharacterized protein n=1 Tax=Talaromyces islandicus TaxID=28573 RepID=A0A0U1LSK2_TALIS|nr:hypothetical protein PISL3812_03375 [Talaromyces islandicus]